MRHAGFLSECDYCRNVVLIRNEIYLPCTMSLVTIKSYLTYPEASAMKMLLESEGISCHLKDENSVVLLPHLANAMAGIKLQVYEQDMDKAVAILKEAGYIKPENQKSSLLRGKRQLQILFIILLIIFWYFILQTIPENCSKIPQVELGKCGVFNTYFISLIQTMIINFSNFNTQFYSRGQIKEISMVHRHILLTGN